MNRKNIFYYVQQLSEPRFDSYVTAYPERNYQANKINEVKIMVHTLFTIDNSPMQRRQFLRSSCNLCLLAGSGVLLSELASCSPAYEVIKTEVVNNQIQIP